MTANLSLPDDFIEAVTEQVCKLNDSHEADALTEREIGGMVDEIAPHLPQGQRMSLYNEVAATIRRVSTRREYRNISGRTVRYWRYTFGWCSKNGDKYQSLSGSFINAAVRMAMLCQTTPEYICEWALLTGNTKIDQMEAHFLPQTSNGYEADHPVISGLLRGINKNWQQHSRFPRLMRLVNLLRAEIKAIQERT